MVGMTDKEHEKFVHNIWPVKLVLAKMSQTMHTNPARN